VLGNGPNKDSEKGQNYPTNNLLHAAMNADEDFTFHGMVSIHLRQKRSFLESLQGVQTPHNIRHLDE